MRPSISRILRYPQIYVDKLFITSVKLLCGVPAASHCLKHERRETKNCGTLHIVAPIHSRGSHFIRKYRVPTSLVLFGNPASVRPKRFMQRSRFEPLLYHLRILLPHTVSTYVNGDFAELFEGGFEVFCDSQASM